MKRKEALKGRKFNLQKTFLQGEILTLKFNFIYGKNTLLMAQSITE